MDKRSNKPSKRKSAKSSHPSHEEKEAMTAELEKARLKDDRPSDQPTLEPPQVFAPPVGDLGTAAPPYEDTSSNAAAASNVCPEGYDYGDCYGGYQATRFNSTQLDDCECDARVEYRYHQATRHPTSAPGYVDAYSAPFNDPNAYGQGHRTSNAATQRESQAPQALNCMERILESIECATSASSLQLQPFFGQGELIHYFRLKNLGINEIQSFAL
jgi:hypothetical protein